MPTPAVSVVIPVHRDWDRLALCLAALANQRVAPFEIIVVDNDDLPLSESAKPSGVFYVHHPEGYSYAARNAGLKLAKGDIIAFTDADCIPEPAWIQAGLSAVHASGCDLVGGEIKLFAEEETLAAQYDMLFGLNQRRYYEERKAFATANLFVRRKVFDKVQGFDADLESFGDFDFCERAAEQGFSTHYAPDAVVRHPTRTSVRALVNQTRRFARGLARKRRRNQDARPDPRPWATFARTLRPPLRTWLRTLKRADMPAHRLPGVLALLVYLHSRFLVELAAATTRSWGGDSSRNGGQESL